MLNFDALRQDLHKAVDDVLNRYKNELRAVTQVGLVLVFVGNLERPYEHKWPGEQQTFPEGKWFDVSGDGLPKDGLRILIARSERDVWSKRR